MTHNVDWDEFHKNLVRYMASIDAMSPLGRWVMNWVDVPPNATVGLFRSFDDRPIVIGQTEYFAVTPNAPLPPDFFKLPKLRYTYRELTQLAGKPL